VEAGAEPRTQAAPAQLVHGPLAPVQTVVGKSEGGAELRAHQCAACRVGWEA
jgi:hypothetical protein